MVWSIWLDTSLVSEYNSRVITGFAYLRQDEGNDDTGKMKSP